MSEQKLTEPRKLGPEQVEANVESAVFAPPVIGELAAELRRLIEATRAGAGAVSWLAEDELPCLAAVA
jgi:hypothetical protein